MYLREYLSLHTSSSHCSLIFSYKKKNSGAHSLYTTPSSLITLIHNIIHNTIISPFSSFSNHYKHTYKLSNDIITIIFNLLLKPHFPLLHVTKTNHTPSTSTTSTPFSSYHQLQPYLPFSITHHQPTNVNKLQKNNHTIFIKLSYYKSH